MKKIVLGVALLALSACSDPQPNNPAVLNDARSGGEATVAITSLESFARPLPNLPIAELRDFTFGNKLFNTNWVIAPASVKSLDGLGPTFNRVSCSGCHIKDGRGRPPLSVDEPMNGMLVRLSVPGENETGGPKPHPHYGDQLQDKANPGIPAEGRVVIYYDEITGQFADGELYSLRRPRYEFVEMAFCAVDDILFSPRVANTVAGLGLLAMVPDSTIKKFAADNAQRSDAIRGRVNQVWDATRQKTVIGRFGWKANAGSLQQQVADAAFGDIGLTSRFHPHNNCPSVQAECANAWHTEEPALSDTQLETLVFYAHTLAIPARRSLDDRQVQRGAALFQKLACSVCHRPSMTTGDSEIPALAHQQIQPFTDFLLHDMGEELADGRPDFLASGREWRTAPLWGIGLVKTVNRHTFFLHDGRARNLEEAVLWHGGTATESRDGYKALPKKDREALLRFLESL